MPVPVPSWNARGVVDPANPSSPTGADRSPYAVSLREFVECFGTTHSRITILQGYLSYRARMHAAGLVSGFQWLDGSFLENIEMLEHRDPKDIDVVTFFDMPPGHNQLSLMAGNPGLFPTNGAEHDAIKTTHFVDGYSQVLAAPAARLISKATYWYSMWSHRRDMTWKGFFQVDLAPAEDAAAAASLAAAAAALPPPAAAPVAAAAPAIAPAVVAAGGP